MAVAGEQRARAADANDGFTTERGVVVTYALADSFDPDSHEARTRAGIATKLAKLKGFEFAGEYDRSARYGGPVYFVPSDVLSSTEAAQALGIHGEDDLFGGVVPHGFAATKVITHPLFDARAHGPARLGAGVPASRRRLGARRFLARSRAAMPNAPAPGCSNADRCASSGPRASADGDNSWRRRATNSPMCSAPSKRKSSRLPASSSRRISTT